MKRILLTLSLLILTGCIVSPKHSVGTSRTSNNDEKSEIISGTITSSVDNSIKECNFEMDLSLYKNVNTKYDYNNEFGSGIVTTNKIYITCVFNFNEDIILNQAFNLTVNNQEVFSQDYNYLDKNITFKIEDPNWSNEY